MQKETGKHENGINRRAGQGARYSRRNENKSPNRKETINKDFWGGGSFPQLKEDTQEDPVLLQAKWDFKAQQLPLTTHLHSNERVKSYNPLSGSGRRRRRRRVSPVKQHK